MFEIIKKSDKSLPIRHQLGKLVIGSIVGFAASELAEKGYDVVLDCIRRKKTAV